MAAHIGDEFMKFTKYEYLSPSDQVQKIPDPPLELEYDQRLPKFTLPSPQELTIPNIDLRHAIENRRSIRKYADTALTLSELSYFLWVTQGIQTVIQGRVTLRTVPSAGARHAFETFLFLNRVTGLQSGLYRYSALDHALILIDESPQLREQLTKACLNQKIVRLAAVTFLWVAVPYRMNWRYSERGYRYLFLDAGHVCQNLYLAAESCQCGVCAIAAYKDDDLNNLLGLDGHSTFVIYLATIGKKKDRESGPIFS